MFAAVAGAMNEPDRSPGSIPDDGVHYADHRGEADPDDQQDDRPFAIRIKMELAARRPDAEFGASRHLVMEIVRRQPRRPVRYVGGNRLPFMLTRH
jgi:hypothetical protein